MSDDNITTDYKAIVLDAAEEMQRNENWYKCFEYRRRDESDWTTCTEIYNPLRGNDWGMWAFRRRENTITALTLDHGLLQIARDHKVTLLKSCEKALNGRDARIAELEARQDKDTQQLKEAWIKTANQDTVIAALKKELDLHKRQHAWECKMAAKRLNPTAGEQGE